MIFCCIILHDNYSKKYFNLLLSKKINIVILYYYQWVGGVRKLPFLILLVFVLLTFYSLLPLYGYNGVSIAVPKWFEPTDNNPSIKAVYDEFSAEYRVKTEVRVLKGRMEDYVNHVLVMLTDNNPTDLAIVPINLVRYLSGIRDLVDFSKYLSKERLDDFIPSLKPGCCRGKAIYGLPYDTDVMVIYYNIDIFKKLNMLDKTRIKNWSWNDLIELSKKLSRDFDMDGKVDLWGFGFPAGSYIRFMNYFVPWLINAGCTNKNPDELLDNPECFRRTLKFYRRLIDEGASPPSVAEYMGYDILKGLIEGKFAMAISGSWIYERLSKWGKFGVLPLPVYKKGYKQYTISSGWAIIGIKKDSENIFAIRLADKLTSKKSMLLKWRGKKFLPVLKSVLMDREISAYWPYSFFADQLLHHSMILNVNPVVNKKSRVLMELTGNVLSGRYTVEQAVKKMKNKR